jgi:Protein of unknown function (DUF3515)
VADQQMRGSPPRLVLAVAVVLPLLLALAAAVVALVAGDGHGTGTGDEAVPPEATAGMPLALPAVAAPAAGSPECAALLAALPPHLLSGPDRLDRRPLAEPAPLGAAAWGADPTAVLRCGLDRPAELIPTAALLEVSGVQWLRLRGPDSTSTWVAVDRSVYVALTLSDDSGTGPLQDVSAVIRSTLDERPVEPVR